MFERVILAVGLVGLPVFSYADIQAVQTLEGQKAKILEHIQTIHENKKSRQQRVVELKAELVELAPRLASQQEEVARLQAQVQNFATFKAEIKKQAMTKLDQLQQRELRTGLAHTFRNGKIKRYIKCVREFISSSYASSYSSCYYYGAKSPYSSSERQEVATLAKRTKITKAELNTDKVNALRSLRRLERIRQNKIGTIATIERIIQQTTVQNHNQSLAEINQALELEKDIQQRPDLYHCSPTTPTIDLERTGGPYDHIIQNDQGGLGTCYANTAKNLLTAATKGQINASYLDIAILYKKQRPSAFALDAGQSCPALKQIRQYGFCREKYSPVELSQKGDSEQAIYEAGFGVFPTQVTPGLVSQIGILKTLDRFIGAYENFANNPKPEYQTLVGHTEEILRQFGSTSQAIGIPKIKSFILEKSDLGQMYIWTYKKKLPKGVSPLSKTQFQTDFENYWALTRPHSIKLLMSKASFSTFKANFFEKMGPFIEKYNLYSRLTDSYYTKAFKTMYQVNLNRDWKAEFALTTHIFSVVAERQISFEEVYQKLFLDKEPLYVATLDYLEKLQSLSNNLRRYQIPVERLLDEQGRIYRKFDLIQLATAPRCLDESNRESLTFEFSCFSKMQESLSHPLIRHRKNRDIFARQWIIHQLSKDLAIGNTFRVPFNWHINSIVGHRYNPEKGECEFKIRESSGSLIGSYWTGSNGVMNRLSRISFLRPKE